MRWRHWIGADPPPIDGPDAQWLTALVQAMAPPYRAAFAEQADGYLLQWVAMSWQSSERRMKVTPLTVRTGDQVVVTWSLHDTNTIARVHHKLTCHPDWVQSAGRVVFTLLDEVLADWFGLADALEEEIVRLEKLILIDRSPSRLPDAIFQLRHQVLTARRLMASLRDATARLTRYWTTQRVEDNPGYVLELHDHTIRLYDMIDSYRESMTTIVDMYLSSVSNRLNEVVKTLSLVTTVLLPGSLIAALYGMNFDVLPFSHHPYGFFGVLGVIALVSGSLLWFFRRRHWL